MSGFLLKFPKEPFEQLEREIRDAEITQIVEKVIKEKESKKRRK